MSLDGRCCRFICLLVFISWAGWAGS